MRCQILRRRSIFHSLHSLIFITYFAVIVLFTNVLCSQVCWREGDGECTCRNSNTTLVHCLTEGFNKTCRNNNTQRIYHLFCEVMSQLDCTTKYSVKWNCTDCLEAYTDWLIHVVAERNTTCLSQCISLKQPTEKPEKLCFDVLAKCPYLATLNGYGNRPAFDCPGPS